MKNKNALFILLIILVAVLSFDSCSLFGVKIDERIDAFIDDLNNDRNSIYLNFHPSGTADYNAIKAPITSWDIWFPTGETYSLSNLDDGDSDSVTATITSTDSGGWGSKSAIFKMAKDGCDWMIEELTLDGTLIVD